MITSDLFKSDKFPDFKLLGGATGLNRKISSVSVIDAPDVDRWLRGGEFLIGSGYIFRDDPAAFVPFMLRVAEKNAAAIGIKLDRFHHSLQDHFVRTADETGMPLIQLPLHYRWTDINELVYKFLEGERNKRVGSDFAHTSLLSDGINPKQLLSWCAVSINCKIIATSSFLELNHVFGPDGMIEGAEMYAERMKSPPIIQKVLPSKGRIVSRMEFRDNPPEWMAVYNATQGQFLTLRICLGNGENTPSFFLDRTVLRVFSLLQATLLENENLLQGNSIKIERFFEGLCLDMYNDPDMIQANFKEFGIRMPRESRVMIIVAEGASSFGAWQPPEAVMSYGIGQFWTGLIDCGDESVLEGLKARHEEGMIYALGEAANDVIDISRSYREASRTVRWIRDSSLPPGVYFHEELCLYGFLDSVGRLPESGGVWRRYWEPMVREEARRRKHQTFSYLRLAEALVLCDFNARLCAKQMFIHYNTMRNHIEKLEDLLKLDISDPNQRLALTLAYYIDKSVGKYNLPQG